MKKKGPGKKRKLNEYKKFIKNKKNQSSENTNENINDSSSEKIVGKEKITKKVKENVNDFIEGNKSLIAASKQSYEYIQRIMTQDATNNINDEIITETNQSNDEKNKNNKNNNLLLTDIYNLFEGYDEIKIKPNNKNQYIITAGFKIEDGKEIKFDIVYDNDRDYFDYFPKNKNFVYKKEDEPFNYDLDIPKEDFSLLINNFKKFKIK